MRAFQPRQHVLSLEKNKKIWRRKRYSRSIGFNSYGSVDWFAKCSRLGLPSKAAASVRGKKWIFLEEEELFAVNRICFIRLRSKLGSRNALFPAFEQRQRSLSLENNKFFWRRKSYSRSIGFNSYGSVDWFAKCFLPGLPKKAANSVCGKKKKILVEEELFAVNRI